MFRYLTIIGIFLITFSNPVKSDLFGDIIEGVGNAVIEEVLETKCPEPTAGVCKCSPYKEGTGNTDIVNSWNNCKGKITYNDGQSLVASFKNGSPTGKKCSAFDANGREYPGDCSSGSYVQVKQEQKVASASSGASSKGEKDYIDQMSYYYMVNYVFKNCAISGGISKKQYNGLKKEAQMVGDALQKRGNITAERVKELKVTANKKWQNGDGKMLKTLMPMMGLGTPRDQLSSTQWSKILVYCDEQWATNTVLRNLIVQSLSQGDGNSAEDLDF